MSICSCLILGLISSSGELDGIGDVDALLLGVEVSLSASVNKNNCFKISGNTNVRDLLRKNHHLIEPQSRYTLYLPFNSRLGVLEAPPSSSKSGGAIDGLTNGGVCTLLLGGLLAVRREGLRLLELEVDI